MPFDFWDDVIKPAWHDVIQCVVTKEMWWELCKGIDLSLLDSLEDMWMKAEMQRLRQQEDRYYGIGVVLAMMMTYRHSSLGVSHFLRLLRASSPHNEGVVRLLENIWAQKQMLHSAGDICVQGWLHDVIRKNVFYIAKTLAAIPKDVLAANDYYAGWMANINKMGDSTRREMQSRLTTVLASTGQVGALPPLNIYIEVILGLCTCLPITCAQLLFNTLSSPDLEAYVPPSFLNDMLHDAGIGTTGLRRLCSSLCAQVQGVAVDKNATVSSTAKAIAAVIPDPWKHGSYKDVYPWLIESMDTHNFRTHAFAQSLITAPIRDDLLVTASPRAHNESLLARLEKGGRRSFVGFVQVLSNMGPAYEETCGRLALLVPRNEASVIDSDKPTDQSVQHMMSAGQSGRTSVQESTQGEGPSGSSDSRSVPPPPSTKNTRQESSGGAAEVHAEQQPQHQQQQQQDRSATCMSDYSTISVVECSQEAAIPNGSISSASMLVSVASQYRSALAKHYEVFERCANFDPMHCVRHLRSKDHMASSVVKVIEAVKNRDSKHEAAAQLVSHLTDLSDDGVLYFVEHYLTGQGLEDVAATIRFCPGPSGCTLDAADHHRQDTSASVKLPTQTDTSPRSLPSTGMVASKEVVSSDKEQPVHSELTADPVASFQSHAFQATSKQVISTDNKQLVHSQPDAAKASVKAPSSVPTSADSSSLSSTENVSQVSEVASTGTAVELASCYCAALEMHYEVIEQCVEFDPVRCARHMRSKRHFATPVVKAIEQAKAADGQAEASARLVTHLSELSDDGVLYFVDQYLTKQGLEDVAATIRLCPGPSDCTLEAADHHRQDG